MTDVVCGLPKYLLSENQAGTLVILFYARPQNWPVATATEVRVRIGTFDIQGHD
jgi:hypothetical protein